MEAIGGTLLPPHMDGDRICAYFGRYHQVEGAGALERIAPESVSAARRMGTD